MLQPWLGRDYPSLPVSPTVRDQSQILQQSRLIKQNDERAAQKEGFGVAEMLKVFTAAAAADDAGAKDKAQYEAVEDSVLGGDDRDLERNYSPDLLASWGITNGGAAGNIAPQAQPEAMPQTQPEVMPQQTQAQPQQISDEQIARANQARKQLAINDERHAQSNDTPTLDAIAAQNVPLIDEALLNLTDEELTAMGLVQDDNGVLTRMPSASGDPNLMARAIGIPPPATPQTQPDTSAASAPSGQMATTPTESTSNNRIETGGKYASLEPAAKDPQESMTKSIRKMLQNKNHPFWQTKTGQHMLADIDNFRAGLKIFEQMAGFDESKGEASFFAKENYKHALSEQAKENDAIRKRNEELRLEEEKRKNYIQVPIKVETENGVEEKPFNFLMTQEEADAALEPIKEEVDDAPKLKRMEDFLNFSLAQTEIIRRMDENGRGEKPSMVYSDSGGG